MLDFLSNKRKELIEKTNYDWSMRVGIHVGPAITGVIGKWRFLFDTWGNTVNLASRLEANSEPNQINVTEEVVQRLKSQNSPFHYEYRGEYSIKNMGTIPMYFLRKQEVLT